MEIKIGLGTYLCGRELASKPRALGSIPGNSNESHRVVQGILALIHSLWNGQSETRACWVITKIVDNSVPRCFQGSISLSENGGNKNVYLVGSS